MASNSLLDAALQYAGRGWRVFPLHSVWFKDASTPVCTCRRGAQCPSAGKHPRIQEGFKGATTDRATLEEWWAKWPQAGIGFATGQGVTVFDFDGSRGRAQLEIFLSEFPEIAGTLICRTGNGCHAYFADGLSTRCSAHDGTDIRGEGGYVILPPTVHKSGRQYEWVKDTAPLPLPEGMRLWAGGPKPPQQRPPREVVPGSVSRGESGTPGACRGTELVAGAPPPWIAARAAARNDTVNGVINGAIGVSMTRLADAAAIGTPWTAHEEARLRAALMAIPASIDGKTWASILMALHALQWHRADGSDIALDMADEWSKTSQGRGDGLGLYRGREDLEKRWAGFSERVGNAHSSVTVASVYHLAAQHGWKGDVVAHANGANGHSFHFGTTSTAVGPVFIDLDRKGRPQCTTANAALAIQGLMVTCRKDVFHEKMIVGGHLIDQWAGDLSDDVIQMLRRICKREFGFDPGKHNCHDAAVQLCLENQFNPVVEYLDGLEWDRKRRIDSWCAQYMGAVQTPFVSAAGRLMLIAAVRRARAPGTKFDQVVVFEGKEGTGKSTAIKILAGPDNFSDQPILAGSDREQQEAFRGVWLHEVAELEGMRRTDVQRLKQFISRTEDRARPAYGMLRVDMKRRGIFVGTTNEDTYLKSETGNRRFWPVATGRIDEDGLGADRDQLWAEAAYREEQGESIVLDVGLRIAAAEEQAARLNGDEWQHLVKIIVDGGAKPMDNCTVFEVLRDPQFGLTSRDYNQSNATRVARILTKLGFERYRAPLASGVRPWKYRRK